MNRPPQIVVALLALTLLLSVDQSIAENFSDQPPGEPALTPTEQTESPIIDPSSAAQREAKRSRMAMVDRQLRGRDIKNPAVLAAMGTVQRHRFVPENLRTHAYDDRPLPIGHRQTISQPYIVALMTQLAKPTKAARALDVGTGSGYQAAVLAELVESVYSIEIVQPLATAAKATLKSLGYRNVHVRHGDGYRGWKEHAPFDLIIVAAAPDHVPEPLIEQLAVGGKLVIPIGTRFGQQLIVLTKEADGRIDRKVVAPVAFVPMTGELVDQK
jgi:protein-L-isoaspartate(D-aspartate) O-methyltransferase